MNNLEQMTRENMKILLGKCTDSQQRMFAGMFCPISLDTSIDEVIDQLPKAKLDDAISQIEKMLGI